MRASLALLARYRWVGVGLALLAEILLLVALALAPPSTAVGIPAAVAAVIGGTVAVVFGVIAGVGVALAGALVFAGLGGWGAGELAAIGIWPAIVAAAGLFARRIESHRLALRQLVAAHEQERRTLAHTLHDENAQTLAGALLRLKAAAADRSDAAAADATEQARALINQTIQALRDLAAALSPTALDDYGLAPALARLADTTSSRTGTDLRFESAWDSRLPDEAERALFRFAQAALETTVASGASTVTLRLAREGDRIVVTVRGRGPLPETAAPPGPVTSAGEHLRLLGGRLSLHRQAGEVVLRAELPATPHALDGVGQTA